MIETMQEMRQHIPVLSQQVYLETASTGLVPDYIYDMARRYQDERYYIGGDSTWQYQDGETVGSLAMIARSRAAIAAMVNGKPYNICFGSNSSQLYSLIISSIPLEPGDNVILPENGWMGGRFAWQIHEQDGIEIRYAKRGDSGVSPEDYIRCIDERTKVVAVNYVESSFGQRFDMRTLGAYCQAHGIITVVDGVQALGVLNIDVQAENIDLLVGNDYKWMMNFCGTGYAYVSDRLLQRCKSRTAGWFADSDLFNTEKRVLTLKDGAGCFEAGFPNVPGVCGLGLAAEQYLHIGGAVIEQYVLELGRYLREQIAKIPGVFCMYDYPNEQYSAITWLGLTYGTHLTEEDLQKASITLSLRGGRGIGEHTLRVALHYYNNRSDVDRLCELLKKAL